MRLQPFLTKPIYRPWMWGGRNLARVLRRDLPPAGPVAESWEVSDVDGAASEVASGPHAGGTLRDLVVGHADALLGSTGARLEDGSRRFPLLVKYLDAHDRLSVQVHPGAEHAARREPGSLGKTEMWLVLEALPGAEVIAGLKPGVRREEVRDALRANRLPDLVRNHAVRAGDVILIPGGRVHALGKGIIVLEIQQTSDVTYRLYDWGRIGADGKPRELHVEQALDAIEFDDKEGPRLTPIVRTETYGTRKLLAVTRHFFTEAWDTGNASGPVQPVSARSTGFSPDLLMFVKGSGRIAWEGGALDVPHGRTAIVPAKQGPYLVELREPSLVVRSRVPDPAAGLGEWTPANADETRQLRNVCDRGTRRVLFGEP